MMVRLFGLLLAVTGIVSCLSALWWKAWELALISVIVFALGAILLIESVHGDSQDKCS